MAAEIRAGAEAKGGKMTDEEFYSTLDALCEHAQLRRQEGLTAANVEQFKQWDAMLGRLDMIRLQRESAEQLKASAEHLKKLGRLGPDKL